MNILPHSVPVIVEHECDILPNNWKFPPLLPGEIHVWRQNLSLAPPAVEAFNDLLSVDESNRAQRFRFEADRAEFIVCRGTLRVLLAAYQDVTAGQLRFEYSEYGRPRLMEAARSRPIEFNVSHSAHSALLAFSRDYRIGVDIEKVRWDFDILEIAEKFFSQSERAVLRSLPADLRYQAFFRCWTRKEAFIKALGEGLSHPLDAFDVSLAPGDPAALLATRPNCHEAAHWTIRNVAVPSGYLAALAIEIETTPSVEAL